MSSKKQPAGDERFLRVQKDPRFWEMPERDHKIKIDKRFQSMFHDKRFTEKYTVDKRGRPINQTSTEDLKRFYKLSDEEEEEEEEEEGKSAEGKKKKGKMVKEKLVKEKLVKEKLVKEKLVKEKMVKEKLVKEKMVKEKMVKADGEAKRGDAGGERPERGVRVIGEKDEADEEEEDEEEDKLQPAEEEEDDDVDLGDSVTDDSEEEDDDDDDDDDDDEDESGSAEEEEEEESGLDSDSDSEPDLARGKGNVETSSDEDDEDSDVDAILRKEEEEIEHDWGELAKDARRSDEVSARLAVCNMDWDRIKAKDLLALINSFVPKEGAVLSVKVFPSEFGKERLKAEQTKGPLELRALPDDSEDDNEEERGYREKLRDYQFKRLKYFYAVVECDSADTAAKVYQECDGYEYESSCSVLDLRFIPDEVRFDEEPKDVATDVNLSAYTPKLFTSSANATSKVQLTWDETDNDRITALSRKFNKDELLAMDFNAYLASSSEEEEEEGEGGGFVFGEQEGEDEDEEEEEEEAAEAEEPAVEKKLQKKKKEEKKKRSEEQISKYRELLKGIRVKEKKLHEDKDMEMEITWVPGLKETTEQLVKKKMEAGDKPTPWEEFLQKKKDRKKQKKSQRKEGEEDEEELSDEDLPPDVDLSDPFFAEELAAADTKKKPKWKKKKKHEEEERTAEEEEQLRRQKAEMSLLMEDEADDAEHKHFNYDRIVEQQNLSKQKRKKLLKRGGAAPEGDDFQVDVKDPRFQAMFTSHLFNLDPSNPNYKKTRATQSILEEKQRRRGRKEEEEEEERRRAEGGRQEVAGEQEVAGRKRENDSSAPTDEGASKSSMDPGLSLLVKSIKSKTQQFQARKKQKFV